MCISVLFCNIFLWRPLLDLSIAVLLNPKRKYEIQITYCIIIIVLLYYCILFLWEVVNHKMFIFQS